MVRELIIPVGTSMLTGWMPSIDRAGQDRGHEDVDHRPPAVQFPNNWLGAIANSGGSPKPPDVGTWLPRFTQALRTDGRTSAEIDSTRRWIARHPDVQVSRIALLVSDTPAAKWVASVLQCLMPALLRNQITVESRLVRRLRAEDMREGLVEFIRVSAHAIKEAQNRGAIPVVNATPGFKAEAALLTLLGALLGAETIYLHEHMQDIIVVPAIPLQWGLQAHEIRTLRQVGEAIARDSARDLGIGSLPSLWPFIERLGDGKDELWGLSALGQMVVESSTEGSLESPPDRNGTWTFGASASEQGHQPHDAKALANEIAERLPFVKMVRLYWWQGHGNPGVMMPKTDDCSAGIIRLRLQSKDSSLRLLFLLYTTAETEGQWQTARLRAAEAFGRVRLVEELVDASEESGASPDMDQAPKELTQLRAEHLLYDRLNHTESRVAELKKQVTDLDEALARANTAHARLTAKLDAQKEAYRKNNELLRNKDQELRTLTEQIESLRKEFEGKKGEASDDKAIL